MKKLILSLAMLSLLAACEDPTEGLIVPATNSRSGSTTIGSSPSTAPILYYHFSLSSYDSGTHELISPGKNGTDGTKIRITLVEDELTEVVIVTPSIRKLLPSSARQSGSIANPTLPPQGPPVLATLPAFDCADDKDLPIASFSSSPSAECVHYKEFCRTDPQDGQQRCILWSQALNTLFVPELL